MKKLRLLALAGIIEKSKNFDQADWCGTKCCVAGHAVLAFGSKKQVERMTNTAKALSLLRLKSLAELGWDTTTLEDFLGFSVCDTAGRILGLTVEQRDELFAAEDRWPKEYTKRGRVTPKLAAKRLRDIVETGIV